MDKDKATELIFDELKVGSIITNTFNYFRVLSFAKSDKVMFNMPLIDLELEEVKFNHNQWEWISVNTPFKVQQLPFVISVAKPVDYVLINERLKDKNGNYVETYMGIEDDDFDDIEQQTRFMLEDNSLYSEFRKNFHIVDNINTIGYYNEEVAEQEEEKELMLERLRKLTLIN